MSSSSLGRCSAGRCGVVASRPSVRSQAIGKARARPGEVELMPGPPFPRQKAEISPQKTRRAGLSPRSLQRFVAKYTSSTYDEKTFRCKQTDLFSRKFVASWYK